MQISLLQRNVDAATAMLQQLPRLEPQVEQASQLLAAALLAGNKLLACGNGGSAADSAHMTTEFVVRFSRDRRAYPAISLTAHGGDLSAIGNDYHFDELFARQVEAYGRPGDVLFAFTTSGNSTNVVRALERARQLGVHTVAMLGRDGGRCAGLAEVELLVRDSVTARIQEAHKLLLHTVCERVEELLEQAEAAGHPATTLSGHAG